MSAIAAAEEWRPVPGHEGLYDVSSLGRVRSRYFDPPRLLTPGTDDTGYPTIMLSKNGARKPFTIHRIVCRAFHGEPFLIWNEAAHLNGDKADARAANLKWCTKRENEHHKRRHGTAGKGGRTLSEAQVREIKAALPSLGRNEIGRLAAAYGVTKYAIFHIKSGRHWRHV